MLNFQIDVQGQHRTIASARFGGSFPPILRFEKFEIHTVFLRFPNLDLTKNLSPNLLAELRGLAKQEVKKLKNISIWFENGKIHAIIDGAVLMDIYSLSLNFIKGSPLLFSYASEAGEKERQPEWLESHVLN